MSGQPKEFDVVRVFPTETTTSGGVDAPAYIIHAGDTLTLETYVHCGGGPVIRGAVSSAGLKCEYYFDSLEAGGTPIKVPGGAIGAPLSTATVTTLAGPGGPLEGIPLPPTGDYYLSVATAPITTSSATGIGTLKPPTGETVGTWRLLTHVHGAAGKGVSAFTDDMLIQVEA